MKTMRERIIVCPDAHHPFVDKRAWAVFLEAAYVAGANRLVCLGDLLDMYRFSRFFKDPRRRETAQDEIEAGNAACDDFDALGIPWHLCMGNHEFRYDKYLQDQAPELIDIAPSLADLLRLNERPECTWSQYGEPYQVGHIRLIHDVGPSGKNSVIQSVERYGAPVVFGHTHRAGVGYVGNLDGDKHVSLNCGWLGDFSKVDYLKKHQTKDWIHAFGVVDIDERGVGYCQVHPIIEGRAMVDGKVVRA